MVPVHTCTRIIIQVTRRAIVGYTGDGKPPCIVMTLEAFSSGFTPPNLNFTVILTGVEKPNNQFQLTRTAENPNG